MDRGVPTSSKLITKRINDRNMQIHLAKLGTIKSTISRQAPQSFAHMKSNKKKHQIAEDRLSEIERENKILLDKMTTIMKAGQQPAPLPQQMERSTHKSLNVNYRKRELVKIAMENQSIMRRLQDQKPIYNRQLWEDSRKQHELYLKNICEYPSSVGLPFIRSAEGDSIDRPQSFQMTRNNLHALVSPKTAEKFYSPPREPTNLSNSNILRRNTEKLDPLNSAANQKTILYQTKKKIGINNYLIHVYLNHDVFNIMASNNERGDFKVLSIPIGEGENLVRLFGSNYKQLIDSIRFKGPKIVFESNSMTIDPSDKTSSQLVTNDGIVETEDENDAELNTSNRKQPSNVATHANHKSAPELQEQTPKVQVGSPLGSRRGPESPQVSTKEQTPKIKVKIQVKGKKEELKTVSPKGAIPKAKVQAQEKKEEPVKEVTPKAVTPKEATPKIKIEAQEKKEESVKEETPKAVTPKEATPRVQVEAQEETEEPVQEVTPKAVENGSKNELEKSVASQEEQKAASTHSVEKGVEGSQQEEKEKSASNRSEIQEPISEKREEVSSSVKDSKVQEPQIEESGDFKDSKGSQQEPVNENTGDTKELEKVNEIREQSDQDHMEEEPVEEVFASQEYQSKEESVH